MSGATQLERRAVMYLRIASQHPRDAHTIPRQRDACQRIAAKHGLAIVRESVDIGQPARLDRQRELQRLLDDLAAKRDAECVVVWDYARLARDMRQLESVIGQIRVRGAEVVTITGVEAAERFLYQQATQVVMDEATADVLRAGQQRSDDPQGQG
jgi:DNA invertase Pin-like site-specific DNA recombinase